MRQKKLENEEDGGEKKRLDYRCSMFNWAAPFCERKSSPDASLRLLRSLKAIWVQAACARAEAWDTERERGKAR